MLRSRRAVSLMECMIALTIFSWVVTALFSVWATHARLLSKSQDHMVAAALAEHVMEAQLSAGWPAEDVTGKSITVTHLVDGATNTREFKYEVKTAVVTANGAVNLKHVAVFVTFKDEHDVERTIQMNTLLSWQG